MVSRKSSLHIPAEGYPPSHVIEVIVNGPKIRALQPSYNFPQKTPLELPHSL